MKHQSRFQLQYLILLILMTSSAFAVIRECSYDEVGNISVKNIEQLGRGYNVFMGNPLNSIDSDEGFISQSVFDFTQLQKVLSSDRKWSMPEGVKFNFMSTCSNQFQSYNYGSMDMYIKTIQKDAFIEGGVQLAGAFQVSANYQKQLQRITKENALVIESRAECQIGNVSVHDTSSQHPILTNDILESFLKVSRAKKNEKEEYYNFFDKYGTHVISSLKLGSRVAHTTELREADALALRYRGFNIETGINVKSLELSDSNMFQFFSSNTQYKQLQNINTTVNTTFKGVPYPRAFKDSYPSIAAAEWLQNTFDKPVPVSFSLIGFDILVQKFTQRESGYLNEYDVNKLSKGFANYLSSYCNDRIKTRFPHVTCSDSTASLSVAIKSPTPIQLFAMNSLPIFITGDGGLVTAFSMSVSPQKQLVSEVFTLQPNQYFKLIRAFTLQDGYYIFNEQSNSCLTESSNSLNYEFKSCDFKIVMDQQIFTFFQQPLQNLYVIQNIKSEKKIKLNKKVFEQTTETVILRVAEATIRK